MSDNHGNTPAAWTAVLIGLVGFIVGAVGVSISPLNYPLMWVGIAIVVAAGVVFLVMAKMGLNEE